jgi:hypothetical protein
MKIVESQNNIPEMLREFESLENIQPSAEWELSLLGKLAAGKPHPKSNLFKTKIIVTLFILLANLGFMLNALIGHSGQTNQRDIALKTISKELLINPSSINN